MAYGIYIPLFEWGVTISSHCVTRVKGVLAVPLLLGGRLEAGAVVANPLLQLQLSTAFFVILKDAIGYWPWTIRVGSNNQPNIVLLQGFFLSLVTLI